MFPILQIGPVALQAPGLILLISLWIGITLAEKSAKLHGLSAENLSNLILIALLSGIIGARLIYAADYPSAFAENPLNLLSLSTKLLDLSGGIAAAIVAALIYTQRKTMPLWQTLDALVPFFGMLAIGLSLANLASGNAFGAETNLPWGIELWNAKRHPIQIYTLLAAFLTLNLLYPPKQERPRPAGKIFLRFVAFTAAYTLFLEAFRGDNVLILFGVRSTQLLAWFSLAAAFIILDKKKHIANKNQGCQAFQQRVRLTNSARQRHKMNFWKKYTKEIAIIFGVILLIAIMMDYNARLEKLNQLNDKALSVRAEATAMIETQIALKTQIALADTETTTEEEARNSGKIQDGDQLIVPLPQEGAPLADAPLATPEPRPVKNWEVWMTLFFGK